MIFRLYQFYLCYFRQKIHEQLTTSKNIKKSKKVKFKKQKKAEKQKNIKKIIYKYFKKKRCNTL